MHQSSRLAPDPGGAGTHPPEGCQSVHQIELLLVGGAAAGGAAAGARGGRQEGGGCRRLLQHSQAALDGCRLLASKRVCSSTGSRDTSWMGS